MSATLNPERTKAGPPAAATEGVERVRAPRASARHPRVTKQERNRRRLESLVVFAVFAIFYGVLGYQMVTDNGVVVFDALDRATRAYMVWWNDPPKLAAIGFIFPPLQSLALLPAAAVKPVATSLVALPLTTAIFAGFTMVVINSVLRRCEMPLPLRAGLLVAFGLNPLWVFYAGNGMSEAIYLCFLSAGIAAFVGFYVTEETRYLIGAGVGLTLAGLTRYGFLIWAVLVALLISALLARRRASGARIEGAMITVAVPIIYGFALWTLFNAVIVGRPFGWLTDQTDSLAVNSNQVAGAGDVTVSNVAERLLEVVIAVSPLALVVVPLLIFTYFARRSDMALWLAALVSLAVILFAGSAVTSDNIGEMTLRSSLPIAVVAVLGLGWAYREAESLRLPVFAIGMVALIVSIPLTWDRMKDYPYQNQEQAFIRALESGDDQTGKQSIGGFTVGVREDKAVAAFLKRTVGDRNNVILTDNAQTFPVILLTGRPEAFFDRVDKGDSRWRTARDAPFGKIRYLLISSARSDLLRQRYPGAADGGQRGFTPVFKTERYTVLAVARRDPGRTTIRTTTRNGRTTTTKTTTRGGRAARTVQTATPTFTPEAPADPTTATTPASSTPTTSATTTPTSTPSPTTITTPSGSTTTDATRTVTTP